MEIRLCLVSDPIENLHSLKSSGSLVSLCKPSIMFFETFRRYLSVLDGCGLFEPSFRGLSVGLFPSKIL